MATAGYTYDDASVQEDLLSVLTNMSPTETQMVSGFGVSTAKSTVHEYLIDTLGAVKANAYTEGADASYQTMTNPSRLINFCQIIREPFQVSDSERAVNQAAFGDRYAYESTKALREAKNDLEYAVLRGTIQSSASTNSARQMRGVKASLSLVTSQSGVSLSESALNDLFELAWNNGATIDEVYGSMYMKRKISAFTANATKNVDIKDKRLVNSVDIYEADAAPMVKLFAHRYMTVSGDTNYDLLGIQSDKFRVAYLRKPFIEERAKTGDATKGEVVMEATLEGLHYNAGFLSQAML